MAAVYSVAYAALHCNSYADIIHTEHLSSWSASGLAHETSVWLLPEGVTQVRVDQLVEALAQMS